MNQVEQTEAEANESFRAQLATPNHRSVGGEDCPMLGQEKLASNSEQTTVRADAPGSRAVELSTIWTHLAAGRWLIAGSACTRDHCYLILRPADPERAEMAHFARECLERVLLGEPQKVLAIDRGVSASTIARELRDSLIALGVGCNLRRAPLLLMMATQASRKQTRVKYAKLAYRAGTGHLVASAVRPDAALAEVLSREERAVAGMLLEGKSCREIASFRQRSPHTVSNQLAAIYEKLGVCGRIELVGKLLC